MVQAQEAERLANACRSIYPDDVVDDSDEALSELDWIREKNAWLAKTTEEMRLLIQKAERCIEELKPVCFEPEQLRLEIDEMLEQVNEFKTKKKSSQALKFCVPPKSRRKLSITA